MNKEFMWTMLVHLGNNMWNEEGNTAGRENNLESVASSVLRFDRELWDKYMEYIRKCGVNTLIIDVAEAMIYESHPELAVEGSWTKEEMRAYVEKKLAAGVPVIEAKKTGNTHAVQGTVGQEVISYTIDKNTGEEIIERVAKVELDEATNQPGWILTKVDSNNQPVVNKNGHLNQYVVQDSKFREMYEPSQDGPNLYSKSAIEKFIQSDEDLHFETKYGDMTVTSGGYIKVTDLGRISGISEQDFVDTYVPVSPQPKTL